MSRPARALALGMLLAFAGPASAEPDGYEGLRSYGGDTARPQRVARRRLQPDARHLGSRLHRLPERLVHPDVRLRAECGLRLGGVHQSRGQPSFLLQARGAGARTRADARDPRLVEARPARLLEPGPSAGRLSHASGRLSALRRKRQAHRRPERVARELRRRRDRERTLRRVPRDRVHGRARGRERLPHGRRRLRRPQDGDLSAGPEPGARRTGLHRHLRGVALRRPVPDARRALSEGGGDWAASCTSLIRTSDRSPGSPVSRPPRRRQRRHRSEPRGREPR